MKRPLSHSGLGIAAVALLLGAASSASAQVDTTRRDTTRARVPITKESPAPSGRASGVPVTKGAAPRADTVTRVSPGEVSLPRDTMPRVEAPVAEAPREAPRPTPFPAVREPRFMFGNRGFTVGLGAGAAMPVGTYRELGYDPGIHAAVPIAWHRPGAALGLRAMLSYDKATTGSSETLRVAPGLLRPTADPVVYTTTLDAVLKLPVLGGGTDGYGLSAYAVGGGGGYFFKDFEAVTPLADALGAGSGKTRVARWGVTAGGGLEWGMGPMAMFAEARWVNVFADGSRAGNDYLRWVPVVVGLTIR